MSRLPAVILACLVLGAAPADHKAIRYLDIQTQANEQLDANLGRGGAGNNFSALPRGEQEFQGIKFKVEDRFILLDTRLATGVKAARKAEGIAVGGTFTRLHMLQGTFYGRGAPFIIPDDTQIGRYTIHYEDGTSVEDPIIYGQDVRDWWFQVDAPGTSRARIAWEGDSPSAKSHGHRIRVYLGTWRNPHPEKPVARVDIEKVGDNPAGPFCIALSVE